MQVSFIIIYHFTYHIQSVQKCYQVFFAFGSLQSVFIITKTAESPYFKGFPLIFKDEASGIRTPDNLIKSQNVKPYKISFPLGFLDNFLDIIFFF